MFEPEFHSLFQFALRISRFGTFFFFHIFRRILPFDFHIFQRGRSTTNQYRICMYIYMKLGSIRIGSKWNIKWSTGSTDPDGSTDGADVCFSWWVAAIGSTIPESPATPHDFAMVCGWDKSTINYRSNLYRWLRAISLRKHCLTWFSLGWWRLCMTIELSQGVLETICPMFDVFFPRKKSTGSFHLEFWKQFPLVQRQLFHRETIGTYGMIPWNFRGASRS